MEEVTCPLCQERMTREEFKESHISKHAEHILLLEPVLTRDFDEGKVVPTYECSRCHKKEPCRFMLAPISPTGEKELICHVCAYKELETEEDVSRKLSYLVLPPTSEPVNAIEKLVGMGENYPDLLKTLILRNLAENTSCQNTSYTCDVCRKSPSDLVRFRCDVCDDYDMCAECFLKFHTDPRHEKEHDRTHTFRPIRGKVNSEYDYIFNIEELTTLRSMGVRF